MCQKCVVEHSQKQFRKAHPLVELSTLRSDVQKEAQELSLDLESLIQTLQPEYNLIEQQRIGLQLLQRSQNILQQAINHYFSELKQTFISLTSNHSNLSQKIQIQDGLEKILSELNDYVEKDDFQISEFYDRDFKQEIQKLRDLVTQFIEKTKREYKKPNLKINDKFISEIPQLISNYISITFEKKPLEPSEMRLPRPRQTLHFTVSRNNSQRLERKMTVLNPHNLSQSQILNHTYLQAISEQNPEDQLIQQLNLNEELQKVMILDQSKIRYLHSLIDSQTLFIHDIQSKANQLISLPESACVPSNAQSLITSDLILYICGGTSNGLPSPKCYKFDNVYGLVCLQNMRQPTNHHSIVFVKGSLYVIGGKTTEGVTDKCWRYVVNTEQWEECASLNEARSHHQSCIFESEDQIWIYTFFGLGQGGCVLDSIEKYSLQEREWQNLLVKNMIPGISTVKCCCIQLDEQKILIYGGYYKNLKNANKMIAFNTYTTTIDNLNQLCMPIGQCQGQPITIDNAIYSLHNFPDQLVPKYSEFGDVLQVLELSSESCRIEDVINCRQLSFKKN